MTLVFEKVKRANWSFCSTVVTPPYSTVVTPPYSTVVTLLKSAMGANRFCCSSTKEQQERNSEWQKLTLKNLIQKRSKFLSLNLEHFVNKGNVQF